MLLALLACGALLAACASAPRSRPAPPTVQAREERYEDVPGVGRVFVREAGARDAPPLVLVHGLGTRASDDFDPLLPVLSRHYRVLTFDLPGFGRSREVAGVYAPARYAGFVHTMIARHFEGPVALLGHSMGGAIALQTAADHPERVGKLALLDVAGILSLHEYLREVVAGPREDERFVARTLRGARDVLFHIGWLPMSGVRLERRALESSTLLRSFFSSSKATALLFVKHDFGPALRRVRAPTFLGWGRHDRVAPMRTAEILKFWLAPTDLTVFEASGHVPMQTEPEAVLDALRTFLELPAAPRAERVRLAGRVGTCVRRRDRVFEGDFDSLTIHRCKGVELRNVRTRSLWIERSEVALHDVRVDGPAGVVIKHSEVAWTGGEVQSDVCMDTHASALDLAGVRCTFRRESLRVRDPSRLVASVSELTGASGRASLHGEYQLFRTSTLEPPPLQHVDITRRVAIHSRLRRAPDDLEGEDLAFDDFAFARLAGAQLEDANLRGALLTGADLRGANLRSALLTRASLRDADLREADLREANLALADLRGANLLGARLDGASVHGARYDQTTILPAGLDPVARRMVEASLDE